CDSFVRAGNRVYQTDEKVGKGKEYQQRPAKPRCLHSRQFLTEPTSHVVGITNFVCEHYYNVGSPFGNFNLAGQK
ncbi:MAG: hypothetical protein E6614_36265, partial [Bradyrhizobium sp.]|nr:hypothetical protein [Bradyrhizobium sp.]